MDFDLTDRQQHWRDRVRDFIERNVRPRMQDYKEEDQSGERWKVLQVVEEEKARGQGAGAVEPVHAAARAARPCR